MRPSAAEAERRPGFSLRHLPSDAEGDLTANGADHADGIALAAEAKARDATVHMPRIACGLAGGRGDLIEPIIERTLVRMVGSETQEDAGADPEDRGHCQGNRNSMAAQVLGGRGGRGSCRAAVFVPRAQR